ncbi:hypothetical protein SYK_03040 [Pseudodesulfovibrio nedwellii]|uniref:Uncharacterized protein n=1 Tax=Pseudodesulfovibrio nedwellii TaxID=2973072 RepID=A0ABN6RY50_9BACT|nr:hypothetical protein [Pseudodesulfovibrio nedwellii]BDQ35944.1 hypothetical protein SYK_03040 [Pseudodesulfovibrio nedwellii]
MSTQETLTMIAFLLAPAFFSLLGMGAIGSPAIAVLGEMSAKTKKRVFFDKYGQQIGAMGLILLILLLVVDGAAYAVALTKFPQYIHALFTMESPLLNTFAAFGIFAFFSLIYFTMWKKMRNAKGLHMSLGMIASLAALTCVALAIPAKIAWTLSHGTPTNETILAATAMILPMSVMYALLTMSAAAALSASYLVLRRNKDDFGRDYYNFSLKLATRWATLPMLGFLGCQGWLFANLPASYKTLVMGTPLAFVWGGSIALGAICAFVWILIGRSESPLRLKGLTFLAVFLFWLMHTLNVTVAINLLTML